MLSSVYMPVPNVSLEEFMVAVKNGQRDFFQILNISPDWFIKAPFSELMENTDDVVAVVNRVLVKRYGQFFGIFPHGLVKFHDQGEVKFVFYGINNDIFQLLTTVNLIFDRLGLGIKDNRKGIPFTNVQKLLALARGEFTDETDNMLHLWLL